MSHVHLGKGSGHHGIEIYERLCLHISRIQLDVHCQKYKQIYHVTRDRGSRPVPQVTTIIFETTVSSSVEVPKPYCRLLTSRPIVLAKQNELFVRTRRRHSRLTYTFLVVPFSRQAEFNVDCVETNVFNDPRQNPHSRILGSNTYQR